MKKFFRQYHKIIIAAIWLALFAALFPVLSGMTVQDILNYTPGSPVKAFFALMALYALKSVAVSLPLTLLYLSAGIMFPVWLAIPVTYAGLALEMSIGYFIGRSLGREGMSRLLQKYPKASRYLVLDRSNSNAGAIVYIVRVVPGPLPLDVMSVIFGASGISYGRYLVFSLLGVSAGVYACVIAGSHITNPFSREFLAPFVIAFGFSAVVFALLKIRERKRPAN